LIYQYPESLVSGLVDKHHFNGIVPMKQYIGQTITGKQLNQSLDGIPLLKFMNDSDVHRKMHYKTGENLVMPFTFQPEDCGHGGLHITSLTDYYTHYYKYGRYARRVWVSDQTSIYCRSNGSLKCDKITMGPRIRKEELLRILFTEYLDLIEKKSKEWVERYIISVLDKSINLFEFIDSRFLTDKIMIMGIEKDPLMIRYIDDHTKIPGIIAMAVKSDPLTLRFIKDEMKTEEITMMAIKSNPLVLRFIKDEMKTEEITMMAIKSNPLVLRFIKDEYKTPGMMIMAVKSNPMALRYIENGQIIRYMKKNTMGTSLPILVEKSRLLFSYMKKETNVCELMMDLVNNQPMFLKFIKDSKKTHQMVLAAVRNNGMVLKFIPDALRTSEIMRCAIKNNFNAMRFIKDTMMSEELIPGIDLSV
jgi:hypothetical protein